MNVSKYLVIDNHTKSIVKEYASDKGKAARNYANKLDLKYGAVRYIVRIVWSDKQ